MIDFTDAKRNALIADVAEEIHDLYLTLGSPEEPTGPSTRVKGFIPGWIDADEIDGLGGDEAEEQVDRYNNAMQQLLELTGIWYAGGNTWYTHWERGTDDWEEFVLGSQEIAYDFIANVLWDRFCDSL